MMYAVDQQVHVPMYHTNGGGWLVPVLQYGVALPL